MSFVKIENLINDIYYNPRYAELYKQDGEYFEFNYREQEYFVRFSAIKRPITKVGGIELDQELYDLETPYGYGGPVTNFIDNAFLKRAFDAYREHCCKQHIVCEFIRFHPFNALTEYSSLFDMFVQERQVVVVNLSLSAVDRRRLYSKTTRNIINKTIQRLEIEQLNRKIHLFHQMYFDTMKKNNADDFYYFDESYFENLSGIEGVDLLGVKLDNQYASIGYFMFSEELAHYHLSANNPGLVKENGNYLLLDAAFDMAKQKGCKYMMLGGGRNSSPEDSLFKFKKKFSPLTMPFYIAGINFMPDKRTELNLLWIEQNKHLHPPNLFQLYRS